MRLPELTAEHVAPALAGELVLLDFYQATCPPCRALEPRLDAFARRHREHVRVYRIDLDHNDRTPAEYGVMSLPTLGLLSDGRELARLDDLIREKDLEALLEQAPANG